ncbi:extracellular protein 9-7, partial [Teratosphaeria destructans]
RRPGWTSSKEDVCHVVDLPAFPHPPQSSREPPTMRSVLALLLLNIAPALATHPVVICDRGVDGNGDCELTGWFHTFCCIEEGYRRDQYQNHKLAMVPAYNHEGQRRCGADGKGKRWCAT